MEMIRRGSKKEHELLESLVMLLCQRCRNQILKEEKEISDVGFAENESHVSMGQIQRQGGKWEGFFSLTDVKDC